MGFFKFLLVLFLEIVCVDIIFVPLIGLFYFSEWIFVTWDDRRLSNACGL